MCIVLLDFAVIDHNECSASLGNLLGHVQHKLAGCLFLIATQFVVANIIYHVGSVLRFQKPTIVLRT